MALYDVRPTSPAIEAAERRRVSRAIDDNIREEWYISQVLTTVNLSLATKVRIATEFVRTKVVYNISRPVTKTPITINGASYVRITDRSSPGEYPKADTTLLMKSIFTEVRNPSAGIYDGYIGTPVDYAIPLELTLKRSFLKRTLLAEKPRIIRIITGPIP